VITGSGVRIPQPAPILSEENDRATNDRDNGEDNNVDRSRLGPDRASNCDGRLLLRHSKWPPTGPSPTLPRGWDQPPKVTPDMVGAVLRHRSPDMTAHYAKVDVTMLQQIVQPWPGDA
jgi:hypothetical protein